MLLKILATSAPSDQSENGSVKFVPPARIIYTNQSHTKYKNKTKTTNEFKIWS